MKPWDYYQVGQKPSKAFDEFIVPLWGKLWPKDFYFAYHYSDECNSTIVYIAPVEYFDNNASMFDDSMPIMHLLPNYLEEIMECVYEVSGKPDIEKDMKRLGFVHCHFFQRYIDESNGIFGLWNI